MRILQAIIQKLACVVVLAAGAALIVFSVSGAYQLAISRLPHPNPMLRVAIGCVVVALTLFALLPSWNLSRRKSRQISFMGSNGRVTIQLDSIAATLNKTLGKLSIIKKVSVRVNPARGGEKIQIDADVNLRKPENTGARETGDQLSEYIATVARRILGPEEIEAVNVNVHSIEVEGAPGGESLESLTAAAAAPAEPIEERTPFTHDIARPAAQPVPSNDFMTYEESARLVQEEGEALAGEAEEPELPVPWERETEGEQRPAEMEQGEQSSEEELAPPVEDKDTTSFLALLDEAPEPKRDVESEDPEQRPSSGF